MEFIRAFNNILWNYTIIVLLIAVGVVYTIGLKLPQFRYLKNIFRTVLKEGREKKEDGVSTFAALCSAVGGQVGTGNIAGVATAIASGGPGAVFWMWLIGILGMATSFAEAVLAQLFKEKNKEGHFVGGPAYYLSKGVGGSLGRALGIFISIIMIIACGFVVAPLQINSLVAGFEGVIDVPKIAVGFIAAIITAVVIFGGIKRITRVAEYIVPFMAIAYLVVAMICGVINIKELPAVLVLIFKSAFGTQAVAGGAVGFTVKQAFRYGCARGMFSNEAGEGTTPAMHAAATVEHPAVQGFAGMFGVIVDTLVVCSSTAFIILCTGSQNSQLTGVNLTQSAVNSVLGTFGPWFILICIVLFAWTSTLSNIYYGETCVYWLRTGNNDTFLKVYRIICIVLLVVGAVIDADLMWEFVDFINAFLVLPNGIGLLLMAPLVFMTARDYEKQRKNGVSMPKWNFDKDPKEQWKEHKTV